MHTCNLHIQEHEFRSALIIHDHAQNSSSSEPLSLDPQSRDYPKSPHTFQSRKPKRKRHHRRKPKPEQKTSQHRDGSVQKQPSIPIPFRPIVKTLLWPMRPHKGRAPGQRKTQSRGRANTRTTRWRIREAKRGRARSGQGELCAQINGGRERASMAYYNASRGILERGHRERARCH